MNYKELRPSNLVNVRTSEVACIHTIHETWIGITTVISEFKDQIPGEYRSDEDMRHVLPIPLTEEWLLKLGFKLQAFNSALDNEPVRKYTCHPIEFQFSHNELRIWLNGETELDEPKYVHQLQNLYFALKGEELTISK